MRSSLLYLAGLVTGAAFVTLVLLGGTPASAAQVTVPSTAFEVDGVGTVRAFDLKRPEAQNLSCAVVVASGSIGCTEE